MKNLRILMQFDTTFTGHLANELLLLFFSLGNRILFFKIEAIVNSLSDSEKKQLEQLDEICRVSFFFDDIMKSLNKIICAEKGERNGLRTTIADEETALMWTAFMLEIFFVK